MEIFKVQHDMVYGIARVCHEANRSFRTVLGQDPGPSWTQCSLEQQAITMGGVQAILTEPRMSAADLHQNWVDDMAAKGWVHGPVKDVVRKTHPCIADFADLPPYERYKDKLFSAIVHALMYDTENPTPEEMAADVVDVP